MPCPAEIYFTRAPPPISPRILPIAIRGAESIRGAARSEPPAAARGRDESGNILETEYGLCEYSDSQGLLLQEMPENAEASRHPICLHIFNTG